MCDINQFENSSTHILISDIIMMKKMYVLVTLNQVILQKALEEKRINIEEGE